MQVFKLCLKIIKKNLPLMIMYVVIFLAVSMMIASANTQRDDKISVFTKTKTNMAFISDEDTPITRGLKEELSKVAAFVELDGSEDSVKDALFFRKIYYVLRIPEGFTADLLSGGDLKLKTTVVPGTIPAVYLDMAVNNYLNTTRLYADSLQDADAEDIAAEVARDLSVTAEASISIPEGSATEGNFSVFFFNYLAYSLLSVLILGISSVMIVLKDKDIQKRNLSSPLSRDSMTAQMFAAMAIFTVVTWIIMVAACFLMNLKNNLNTNFLLFMLNSFVFALTSTGISFLIANLISGRNAISAVNNIVTMGSCFLGGVFVPQAFLGPTVLQFARLLPTYWYVRANTVIGTLSKFELKYTSEIYSSMAVVAAFGIAAFGASILLGRRRSLAA
ncbi:MAG: ABC transporter permease [Youngiibacter sp.]|nr:ABC transporter permease [Youngiibacter sp.]